jgi:hypothetical protein
MFNNLRELIATMPDEKACRYYLKTERWNGVPICPYCGFDRCYVIESGKRFKCASKACYKKFSVTIGTIFEASNITISKWLMAIYICTAHKKGISSYQLAKDIGISQKSSWFMLHRIRTLMKEMDLKPLTGTVEADETYISRKYRSDFVGLAPDQIDYNLNNHYNSKGVALGLAHPESGTVRIKAVDTASKPNISANIRENVEPGSHLHTDEHKFYNVLNDEYDRKTIHHSSPQWSFNGVTTNHVGKLLVYYEKRRFWYRSPNQLQTPSTLLR